MCMAAWQWRHPDHPRTARICYDVVGTAQTAWNRVAGGPFVVDPKKCRRLAGRCAKLATNVTPELKATLLESATHLLSGCAVVVGEED